MDQFSTRVQRLHLCMMQFDYVITPVPRKNLEIVDALFRFPFSLPTAADSELQKDVRAYMC